MINTKTRSIINRILLNEDSYGYDESSIQGTYHIPKFKKAIFYAFNRCKRDLGDEVNEWNEIRFKFVEFARQKLSYEPIHTIEKWQRNLYLKELKIHQLIDGCCLPFMADSFKPLSTILSFISMIQNVIKDMLENASEFWEMELCTECNDNYEADTLTNAYSGDVRFCEDCGSDFHYNENADMYIRNDDYDYDEEYHDEEESDFEGVLNWDYDVLNQLTFKKLTKEKPTNKYLGLEWEFEARNNCPHDFPQLITDYLKPYCLFKGDGSLSYGFELVSCPATLAYHKKKLEKLFNWSGWLDNDNNTFVKGWNTDTAGIHVHINKKYLSQLQIGKLLIFINNKFNDKFIRDISGRDSSGYAKRSNKSVKDGLDRHANQDKYQAVNLAHKTTVELRIFRSNVTKDGLFRVLEFTDALITYLQHNSYAENKQHFKEFLRWFNNPVNKSDYPYFYTWLLRKGYLIGKPVQTIANEMNKAIDNVVNG